MASRWRLRYDAGAGALLGHESVPLPGPYERALVLAAGLAPLSTDRRMRLYQGVSGGLATRMVAKLALGVDDDLGPSAH
jgi:hypothetical protein